MHAKSSLTSAYPKLGCFIITTSNIQLSQLMLNLYVVSRAGSFSRHAVHMLPLCDYYDLCGADTALLYEHFPKIILIINSIVLTLITTKEL